MSAIKKDVGVAMAAKLASSLSWKAEINGHKAAFLI
jgi:hypothetical protein